MSRVAILNSALAVLVAALVGTLVYLESTDDDAAPPTTTSTTTTVPPTTSTTSTSTTTSTTSTTTTTTTTIPPTTLPPFPRSFIDVVVVNGSTADNRLGPTVAMLRDAGYVIVRGLVGAVQTPETRVYYLDETFEAAAQVLALDAGLAADEVAPFDEAPPIPGLATAQLVLYLGGAP